MNPPDVTQDPHGQFPQASAHDGLNLDARQRAMLAEMKIPVWWPEAAAVSSPVDAGVSAVPAGPTPSAAAAPVADRPAAHAMPARADAPVMATAGSEADGDGDVDQMDWLQLRATVQNCRACGLCEGRKAPVFVADPVPDQTDWLIVGEPPDEHEERAGAPFVGATGELLDNMLRAVRLSRDGRGAAGARLTPVVKCRPAAVRNPSADELAHCAVYLRREIVLSRPKVIVAMGRFAAMSLLGSDYPELLQLPFGQVRGKVYRAMGVAVVVTYHPSKLLRAPLQKAHVWADLCLARAQTTTPSSSAP